MRSPARGRHRSPAIMSRPVAPWEQVRSASRSDSELDPHQEPVELDSGSGKVPQVRRVLRRDDEEGSGAFASRLRS